MDKSTLEGRKAELEKRFEEAKVELKEASQKVSVLQNELIAINGAYTEISRLLGEKDEKKKP